MASPVRDSAWLEWMERLMGAGSRQSLTAKLPPQQFHCLLEELPLHLLPRRGIESARESPEASKFLFLNPECSILSAGQVPAELTDRKDLLDGFCLESSIAWVRDRCTGFLLPFWLGAKCESILSQIRAGEAVAKVHPGRSQDALEKAGILIPAGYQGQRISEWQVLVERGAEAFRRGNYFPLSNLIHPFHIAALRRYYRAAIRRGLIRLGDEQSPRRYVAHNELVARYFHHQITGVVSAIVGEPVKPSYVYLASYLSGAELKKHTDREQCEFSVTLCLDFSPEPEQATPWPIRVDIPEGRVAIYQEVGDGLVYRGTRVPHYRGVLGQGCTSTSMFFHYVPADFSGPLD
ncbi:MAG: hypothetical protein WCC95_02490 [Candidatus Sulfotelmatobacter sp.]|jgi:hypothetical protein